MCYLCSENKGADPVSLFSHMQNAGFLITGLIFLVATQGK